MSLYTTTINEILINYLPEIKEMPLNDLIDQTYSKYFSFDFPWYSDDASKVFFEKMFLRHYMPYEIGQETLGKHKLMLQSRLYEIMPEYSNAFEAMNINMEWGNNVDMKYTGNAKTETTQNETGTEKTTETRQDDFSGSSKENSSSNGNTSGNSESNTNQNTQNINSDNPQVNFSGTDYASDMSRGETVNNSTTTSEDTTTLETEVAKETNDTKKTDSSINRGEERNSNTNTNNDETKTEKGNRGLSRGNVYNEMIKSFVNINNEIINRCNDLFLLVYN